MKKIVFLFLFFGLISCKKESQEPFGKAINETQATTQVQNPEELGKTIFEGKGACIACHKIDVKLVGPSLQDIAKIYKEKKGDMIPFLRGERLPIVDREQYKVMKPNLELTKTFSQEELEGLEAYIYSNLK